MNLRPVILALGMFAIGIHMGYNYCHNYHTDVVYYPYYKNVSHVDWYDSWVPLSNDAENDIAYFTISSDMTDFTVPSMGEQVRFMGDKYGEIDEMSPNGFNVKVEPGTAEHGMSGTPCFNSEGEVIGYVSASVGSTHIYCIWR